VKAPKKYKYYLTTKMAVVYTGGFPTVVHFYLLTRRKGGNRSQDLADTSTTILTIKILGYTW